MNWTAFRLRRTLSPGYATHRCESPALRVRGSFHRRRDRLLTWDAVDRFAELVFHLAAVAGFHIALDAQRHRGNAVAEFEDDEV